MTHETSTAQIRAVPPRTQPARPRLSVVIATYNRKQLLVRLLDQFVGQTLPPGDFEVVVVDDGSKEPVKPALEMLKFPFTLRVEEQKNAGAAAARHRGVLAARAEIVLITDDDMQVGSDFLARHLERHPPGSRNVVVGWIKPDPAVKDMPLFERWYAFLNNRMAAQLSDPRHRAKGVHLYTGNVSFHREDYLSVGGFDPSLGQSEDIELGLRLEKAGCRFEFTPDAYVLHGSDHTSFEKWIKRAHRYGIFDSQVAEKHPDSPQVSPWRVLFEMSPLARPLLASAVLFPKGSQPLTTAVMGAAKWMDGAGLEKAAYAGTSVAYAMEYLRGALEHAGSTQGAARGLMRYFTAALRRGGGDGLLRELRDDAVEMSKAARGGDTGLKSLAWVVLNSDSYRVAALNRVREAARRRRIPGVNHALRVVQTAMLGIEIGKDVTLGRGVYFVHSLGIVIGGDARVGDRVRFYGNNTVGTAKDNGYPIIEDDVEVGAGARILGPVRVGARSKIGANAVVLSDVPPDSVVVGIPAKVVKRKEDGE